MKAARVAMRTAVLLALAWGGPMPTASAAEVTLGSLRVSYDDGVWRSERLVVGQVVRFTCFSRDCPGVDGMRPDVYALARPTSSAGSRSCDSAQAFLLTTDNEYGGFSYERATYAGVEFHVTGLVSACGRYRQPLLIQACGVREGTLYWLTTAFSGCSPEPDLPKARFDEILRGFSEGPLSAP